YRHDVSAYGIHDMGGNMGDVCRDPYVEDKGAIMVRGGSWLANPVHSRAASKEKVRKVSSLPYAGFRLVHYPARGKRRPAGPSNRARAHCI
ncbi:SUMF1/EgtB/PvdO family nonheme iron enzyme, partial [Acidobacteriota bacterium]